MNRRAIASLFAVAVAAAVVSPALAVPYQTEITGGFTSYTANVAYRLGLNQVPLSSATGVMGPGVSLQAPGPGDIVDFDRNPWQLSSLDTGEFATMTVTLDKVYDLNKIHTQYLDLRPATYDLELSTDNVTYVPVATGLAVSATNLKVATFASTPAKYIRWTIHGPGENSGGTNYAYPQELQAFVASTSLDVPQLADGYNLIPAATVIATSGDDLSPSLDESFFNFSTPSGGGSKTLDLGALIPVGTLRVNFYPGQSWVSGNIAFSKDNVTYTNIVNLGGGPLNSFDYQVPLALQYARYIRLTGQGGGALVEIGAFAQIPEPTTLMLIPAGLSMLLMRRKR